MLRRRWHAALLTIAIVATVCAASPPPSSSSPFVVASLRWTAAHVRVEDEAYAISGSGVVVAVSDGVARVLTASHVAASGGSVQVTFWGIDLPIRAVVEAREATLDLALLRAAGVPPSVRSVRRAGVVPPAGTQVLTVGSPLGQRFAAQHGWIANEAYMPRGGPFIALDFPATPGTSGAAVCTMTGDMIGLMSMGLRHHRLCLAIPIGRVNAFLDAHGIGR